MVDLLVAMCRAALESPRKSIIFEPYPSVVDPNDPKTLAFNPKVSTLSAVAMITTKSTQINSKITFICEAHCCNMSTRWKTFSWHVKVSRTFWKTSTSRSDFRSLHVFSSLIAYNGCLAEPMNTEEELWETAESTGQCHVHSGDDPGTRKRREGEEGRVVPWC